MTLPGSKTTAAEHEFYNSSSTNIVYIAIPIDDYLDDLESERRRIIERLRNVDSQLIRHGRLNKPTLKDRIR